MYYIYVNLNFFYFAIQLFHSFIAIGTRCCIVRYNNDLYKCLYDNMTDVCDALASYIYTTYELITYNRFIAAYNCSVSK